MPKPDPAKRTVSYVRLWETEASSLPIFSAGKSQFLHVLLDSDHPAAPLLFTSPARELGSTSALSPLVSLSSPLYLASILLLLFTR